VTSESSSPVLVAEGLSKSYGPRPALRGLSFSLAAGRILGLLGPIGAGKTTAIRILTTMLAPSSGRFFVDGISSESPETIRRRIGVLPESLELHKQMTGLECLTFFGQLYGRTAASARSYGLALLDEVGLEQRGNSLVGTYSRGMRQKLGIARALVNDPAVLFLDEPTLGLDPRGQQELLALVRWMARERNAAVVLCSHTLAEVESVCEDVVILSAGQVVASGLVTEVIGQAQRLVIQRRTIRLQVPVASVPDARRALEAVPDVARVVPTWEAAGCLQLELSESANSNGKAGWHVNNMILDALIRAEIPILRFEAEGGRLQEAFLHLTEQGHA